METKEKYPEKFMLCGNCKCLKSEHDKNGCHHHNFDEVCGCDCKKFIPSDDYDSMSIEAWLDNQDEKEKS